MFVNNRTVKIWNAACHKSFNRQKLHKTVCQYNHVTNVNYSRHVSVNTCVHKRFNRKDHEARPRWNATTTHTARMAAHATWFVKRRTVKWQAICIQNKSVAHLYVLVRTGDYSLSLPPPPSSSCIRDGRLLWLSFSVVLLNLSRSTPRRKQNTLFPPYDHLPGDPHAYFPWSLLLYGKNWRLRFALVVDKIPTCV